MTEKLKEIKGANMDIDFIPNDKVSWKMDKCPWNEAEGTNEHKCAVKNVSICKYFQGVKRLDTVICSYSNEE